MPLAAALNFIVQDAGRPAQAGSPIHDARSTERASHSAHDLAHDSALRIAAPLSGPISPS
jgi:hypothetical protein